MPPKINPLPELIPNRMMMLREILRGGLWQSRQDFTVEISPVRDDPLPIDQAPAQPYRPITPGDYFGEPFGEWQQCFFKVEVGAPQADEAGRRFFFWNCRGETLVYIDGQPWAGLDVAHPFCRLPDRACTLWLDCATYQTCMWVPDMQPIDPYGLRFEGAWTAARNEPVWQAFYDLDVLVELMTLLLKRDGLENMVKMWGPYPAPRTAHPVTRKLLALFDEAWLAWEAGGLAALAPALRRIYAALPAESWQPKVTVTGHSHLDLVWMWPEVEGERKAIHTIATALRLLEEYPQYTFMWTSPHSMRIVQERFPQIYAQIEKHIREGRWEATGGAWVEFDTLIASGEALARSLALGQREFLKLRGSISNTLWLPDCFGFNAALPQIMALAGVQNFYTAKLSWNSQTRFPYDSFVWRSDDGSEVLVHMDVTAAGLSEVSHLAEAALNYRELAANNEILKYSGVGDGGGGTMVASLEKINRLTNLSQLPQTQWGAVEGFFERLAQAREKLPVYAGELYLEFHRGIYTTQSEFKRRYRQLERALQIWESARVLAGGAPIPEHYWQRLSFAQFHDALPGSSIQLVYEQLGQNLEDLAAEAGQLARAEAARALQQSYGAGQTLAVYNPLAIDRGVVVELPSPQGAEGPLQKSAQGEGWLASMNLQGLGIHKVENQTSASWEVTERVLDNGLLRVEFDEQGCLACVFERKHLRRRQEWPLSGTPRLILHPDTPPTFDAWEIDHTATRQTVSEVAGMPLSVIEAGPVRAVLSGKAQLGEASCVEVSYILEAGSDLLHMEMKVDWREEHRLLRYYLPTALRGREARYGAPFGAVSRPQVPGTPREEAMWEVPASRWAAVTDDAGWDGLAIITEAKYGFACRDGELALTLLRAPSDPAENDQPRRHRPDHSPERGQHRIRFAIGRYHRKSTGSQLSTAAQAEALFAPVLLAQVAELPDVHPPFRFVSDLLGLVPSWLLPSQEDDGYIIRLHETAGTGGTVGLAFSQPPIEVCLVDFLERPTPPGCLSPIGPTYYHIDYGPYQVLGIKVKVKK